jgi:hypothetical protein
MENVARLDGRAKLLCACTPHRHVGDIFSILCRNLPKTLFVCASAFELLEKLADD